MSSKYLPPLHLAASEDELRPAMCHVQIKGGIATATNGHVLAQLNLAAFSSLDENIIQRLNGFYIHADTWKLIHDAEEIEFEDGVLTYHKGGIMAEIKLSDSIEFPDYSDIVNKVANSKFDTRSFLALNPKHFELCKKLFNAETVVVRFYQGHEMMVFFPGQDAKGYIGIMPVAIDQQDAVIDFSLA